MKVKYFAFLVLLLIAAAWGCSHGTGLPSTTTSTSTSTSAPSSSSTTTTSTSVSTTTSTLGYITYTIQGYLYQGTCPYTTAIAALYKNTPGPNGLAYDILTFGPSGNVHYSLTYSTNEASPRNYVVFAQSPMNSQPIFYLIKYITLEADPTINLDLYYQSVTGTVTFPAQATYSMLTIASSTSQSFDQSTVDGRMVYSVLPGETAKTFNMPVIAPGTHYLIALLNVNTTESGQPRSGDFAGEYSDGLLPGAFQGPGIPTAFDVNGSSADKNFTFTGQIP